MRYQFAASGGFPDDMHEFRITSRGTALSIAYQPRKADLSSIGGVVDGWLLDCIFQEVDIASGNMTFQWSAYAHFGLDNTLQRFRRCSDDTWRAYDGCGRHEDSAFDYFHMNSIELDHDGNYLISARHLNSLCYIDGRTGDVLWVLGGMQNQFEDLSDGAATNFSWQHHVRWHGDQRLSMFDNAAHAYDDPVAESRGLVLQLDTELRTVKTIREYYHPDHPQSISQGSTQLLDNGNVFVGWGHSAFFTEFSAGGEVLCDVRFGASAFYSFGAVASYRAYRSNWVGKPKTPIDTAIVSGRLFVSWNGATEVRKWQLEASLDTDDQEAGEWKVVRQVRKAGFETEVDLACVQDYDRLRVTGLDKAGEALGVSAELEVPDIGSMVSWLASPLAILVGIAVVSCLSVISAIFVVFRSCRRMRESKTTAEYYLLPTFSGQATGSADEVDESVDTSALLADRRSVTFERL
jgi:hypothetical protein